MSNTSKRHFNILTMMLNTCENSLEYHISSVIPGMQAQEISESKFGLADVKQLKTYLAKHRGFFNLWNISLFLWKSLDF